MNDCTCPEWVQHEDELCPSCLRAFEEDRDEITCDTI